MKKIKIIVIMLILFCATLFSTTYAWYAVQTTVDLKHMQGNILTSYFHCGDGSEENPYVITRPVHLYNLTELYQKLENFDTENYHFQIGYDLDNDGDLEVYSYNDNNRYTKEYSNILNMSYYADKFVPIGTVDYPFNGTFDGGNITINNLTVIGSGETDVGMFGYVGLDATIKNIYLDNLTIDITNLNFSNISTSDGHTEHDENYCYVGYIAGHCETYLAFENIYLNHTSIEGISNTGLKNNYGLFGYAADAATLEKMVQKAKGDETGFGGSVDMEEMYNRIESLQGRATKLDLPAHNYYGEVQEDNSIPNMLQYYYNQQQGSFVWFPYGENDFSGNYNYLGGGIQSVNNYYNVQKKTGYRIYNGSNYISNTGTTLDYVSNEMTATVWTLSGTPGNNNTTTISVGVPNGNRTTTYYIRNNNNNIQFSTTSTEWTFIANGSGYRLRSGNRYLRYNNGWSTTNTAGQATTFTFKQGTFDYATFDRSEYNYDYLNGQYNTYFPLITNDDYTVATKNTGYVISGASYINEYDYLIKSGDIRVSKYATSNINGSYSARNGLTTVYTIDQNGSRQTVKKSDYVRYETAESDFLESISSGNVYGLHFMNGLIDKNKVVNIPYVLINGDEFTNYKMPADSIDFNLADKGYITFFAGTYFSGNDSFFSLHAVERDENNNITDIKEIVEILSDNNPRHDYIYRYSDGSYSGDITGYSVIFKTSQIKQNNLTDDAVYYFEIPVNEGEYALGSVDGGTGAYLMYLDIGTNGGGIESIKNFEKLDYKDYPDTSEITPFLFEYVENDNENINITVEFKDNIYYVTATADKAIEISFGILKKDIVVIFNDVEYNKMNLYKIKVE